MQTIHQVSLRRVHSYKTPLLSQDLHNVKSHIVFDFILTKKMKDFEKE